ncbi:MULTISPECIES: YciE/YciF ferroxidase family protein [Paracoccus]|jgi:ferritin-like metal-binding protein YciE|uniref:Ferritin-like domain-containing protein n=1 Tax=Paracoccus aerius TaxID=1915382 RepID=A0ABS1S6I2_9RHOB|nr:MULTISPECIES: ferritin-like domain-containing protein [Paracoccus]MBL3673719.1 ferritin-like domain-containing protein [Paracoccus aerius]QIR84518.1 ferritin-like domain-containing protein [Paracoccus sp. AK26]GHG22836.1 YciE/YciF family protein [Paracoccus aerius]
MAEQTLDTLFHETLKDIYYAERKITTALRKMARAAQHEELKAAFEMHEQETQGQIERLTQVFELIGKRPRGKTCDAIEGIIAEGEEIMDEFKGSPALDAGLLAAAQAVEHYEISRYGTLKAWAQVLGMTEAVALLDETLNEESATDEKLTGLADSVINAAATEKAA